MFNIDNKILDANSERWHYRELTELITATEDRFNEVATKSQEKNYQSILTDFFGKAVLYIKEIITLLYRGFPDGASALSGELFETSVTLSFLEQYKNDNEIFERYFDNIELCSIIDSMKLLSFLKEGAEDKKTSVDLSDMIERKKRNYSALKTKNIKFLSDGTFHPYWWTGDILEKKDKNFSGILKRTVWDKTIFKHIYNMIKHSGHNAVNPYGNTNDAAVAADPSTEGFQIPLCFSLTAFNNITKIVFMNDEIQYNDIEERLNKIIKPMFSEIWK